MKFLPGVILTLGLCINQACGFALLGPYADWMDVAKSYRAPGDIGGPMNLSEGYRWNVPTVTYGFERSFLDYFGSNGVAAVEAAVQTLNQLPPASQLNPTNYPLDAWRVNFLGQALNLVDLKSAALSALVEQLGLARPEPNVFCVRDFAGTPGNYTFFVIRRNFDPITAQPSSYINETLFTYDVVQYTASPTNAPFCDAVEATVAPLAATGTTVAGFGIYAGRYADDLSQDDVGGLRFLLNGNQIRHEEVLPEVQAVGGGPIIRTAARSGVEKITFVRQPSGTQGRDFDPVTNRWTDICYIGNAPVYQAVERVITQPDILFSARDLGPFIPFTRTGTTNWANHAGLNGNPGGAGPGVIQPRVTITFNNVGQVYYNYGPTGEAMASGGLLWGSFDGGTNAPIVFPAGQVLFKPSPLRLRLATGAKTNEFQWTLTGPAFGRFHFQSSTNLSHWQTLATVTNSGVPIRFELTTSPAESRRFFRTIPD